MVLKVVSFYIIHYVTLNGCGPLHNASSKTGTRKGAREQTFSIGNKSSKLIFTRTLLDAHLLKRRYGTTLLWPMSVLEGKDGGVYSVPCSTAYSCTVQPPAVVSSVGTSASTLRSHASWPPVSGPRYCAMIAIPPAAWKPVTCGPNSSTPQCKDIIKLLDCSCERLGRLEHIYGDGEQPAKSGQNCAQSAGVPWSGRFQQ